jgi:hypothetical protein
MNYKHKH